jgi:hypothetical protein
MRRVLVRTSVVFVALFSFVPSALDAQGRATRGSDEVREIMQTLRDDKSAETVAAILRQRDGPRAATTLDALGDSIVDLVIGYDGSSGGLVLAQAGTLALGLSARSQGAGTPYAGAVERLMKIAEDGRSRVGAALYYVSQAADVEESLTRLSHYAASDRQSAHTAVRMLGEEMGVRGVEAVRELRRSGKLREHAAQLAAEELARRYHWPKTD